MSKWRIEFELETTAQRRQFSKVAWWTAALLHALPGHHVKVSKVKQTLVEQGETQRGKFGQQRFKDMPDREGA
jgi:hypothetical protein